ARPERASLKLQATHFKEALARAEASSTSDERPGLRRRHLATTAASFTIGAATAVFVAVAAVASLRRRHCSRWSSPSSLLFATVAVAAAPLALALDQVSSSPRFYCAQ
ncbi:hypothetical protein BHM03_00023956, partial [Ensete ventricosum]